MPRTKTSMQESNVCTIKYSEGHFITPGCNYWDHPWKKRAPVKLAMRTSQQPLQSNIHRFHVHSIMKFTLEWQNHAQHTYGIMFHTMENTMCIISFTLPLSSILPSRIQKVREEGPPGKCASMRECSMHCYLVYQSFPVSAYVTKFL